METLAERFDRLIKANNFKPVEFSKFIGVSQPTISRILNGSQKPTADTLYKASKQLNVTMEYLLTGVNESLVCEDVSGSIKLTPDETTFIEKFRAVTNKDRKELNILLESKFDDLDMGKSCHSPRDETAS